MRGCENECWPRLRLVVILLSFLNTMAKYFLFLGHDFLHPSLCKLTIFILFPCLCSLQLGILLVVTPIKSQLT